MVGEPAQIASWLATNALGDKERYTYFDWRSKGESMEERVVLRVKDIAPGRLRSDLLLKDYLNVMEQYADEPLLFDTTEVMLKEVWLVYPDGHEVLFEQGCDDYNEASRRILSSSMGVGGNVLVTEYEQVNDSTMVPHDYCLMRDNPLASTFESMNEMMDRLSGFRLDYRDARKATLIIVK